MAAVLTAGVELDEVAALKAVAAGFGPYSTRERELITLRYQLRTNASTFDGHTRRFAQSADTRELMRSHFLVGPDFPPVDGLPDVMCWQPCRRNPLFAPRWRRVWASPCRTSDQAKSSRCARSWS